MRATDILLEPVKKYRQSINPPYKRKDLISILGTVFILLAIPLTVFVAVKVRPWGPRAAGTAASPTTIGSVIEPGSMVTEANYIIFIDGSNYYAKNGKTGEIQYSGTDAATVINTAIAALPAGGGKVVLSEGTFNISTGSTAEWGIIISLSSNCTLEGQGGATVLKLAANAAVNRRIIGAWNKSNVTLKNLTIDGNRENQTGNTHVQVEFDNVNGGLIENVEVRNSDFYGMELGGGSGVIVRNCRVHNTQSHGIITSFTATDHIIEGNVVYDIGMPDSGDPPETGGAGIVVGQGDRIVIANNNIYDMNDDNGIRLRMARYSTVVGNSAKGDAGISIMTEKDDPIEAVGNTITGNTTGGFRKDNILGYVGILLQRGGGGTGSAIHDNTIVGNTIANTGRGGIQIEGASNNLVEDNVIYDTDHDAPGGPMGGWGGAAIWVQKIGDKVSDGNLIQGNKIRNDPGHYQDFGILIDAGCSGNTVRYNEISGMTQVSISNHGTGTIIQSNIGYLTENSGTATIASGSTYVDVNHGLAVTPSADDIQVTATNNLGNANKFWISNVGASSFRINVDVAPGGTSTATFAWKAEVK